MSVPSSAPSRPTAADALPHCAVCGTGSRQPPFRSDPPEQAPDLDLRPGEPVRSTMARWLQQCPGCGYAAPNISRAHPAAAQAVAAAPFRALLAETAYPPLARRFLAWAHVLEETGALHAAAEATLQAAWVADDLGKPDLARMWRLEAVALWRSGPPLDPEQTVRVIDALRRAEAWDDAAATAEALARSNPPEAVAQVVGAPSQQQLEPLLALDQRHEHRRTGRLPVREACAVAGELRLPGRHRPQALSDRVRGECIGGHRGQVVIDVRDRHELGLGDGRTRHAIKKQKPPRAWALAALAVSTG